MKTYRIATIPGDGIGKEVVPAGQQVLEALAKKSKTFAFDFEDFDWGGDYYRKHGVMMPADGLDALRDKDAILFGSAGDPDIPDHITLWGLRLKICQGFDQYANVRPTRILPGIDAPLKRCRPEDLNWVIVRENSEGEYSGVGGRVHQGHPIEAATDVSILTRAGVERIMRFAFRLAQSRPRKLLTVITKSNAQRHAMVMWDEIALEISKEFPDVKWDKELVDASTARMINRPATLDTIVATNLHADILSDLAAALAGSLGIAPTANIDPERRYPSMFEPIHGSAFDIMGKGLANPVGTFWSVVMLLEHLGEFDAARRVMRPRWHGHDGAGDRGCLRASRQGGGARSAGAGVGTKTPGGRACPHRPRERGRRRKPGSWAHSGGPLCRFTLHRTKPLRLEAPGQRRGAANKAGDKVRDRLRDAPCQS
jgi:tartrate dehydrogenase/decarboxylase/D-malate dehydrogenase